MTKIKLTEEIAEGTKEADIEAVEVEEVVEVKAVEEGVEEGTRSIIRVLKVKRKERQVVPITTLKEVMNSSMSKDISLKIRITMMDKTTTKKTIRKNQ